MAAEAIAQFGDPEVETRLGRDKWTDDTAAVEPLDALVALFAKTFAKNDPGYKRSVTEFDYPALAVPGREDKDSEGNAVYPEGSEGDEAHAKAVQRRTSRIAERLNARAEATDTAVHARVIRGKLHMVTGKKPVITRNRKGSDGPAEAA